jgi:hypothetical protein
MHLITPSILLPQLETKIHVATVLHAINWVNAVKQGTTAKTAAALHAAPFPTLPYCAPLLKEVEGKRGWTSSSHTYIKTRFLCLKVYYGMELKVTV